MNWNNGYQLVNFEQFCHQQKNDVDRLPSWARAEGLYNCEKISQVSGSHENTERIRLGIATALRELAELIYPQQLSKVMR